MRIFSPWSNLIQIKFQTWNLYKMISSFQRVQEHDFLLLEMPVSKRGSCYVITIFEVQNHVTFHAQHLSQPCDLHLKVMLLLNLSIINELHKSMMHYPSIPSIVQVPFLFWTKVATSILKKVHFKHEHCLEPCKRGLWPGYTPSQGC